MKIIKYIKIFLVSTLFLFVTLVGIFYFSPQITEKNYPPPKSAEYIKLQKKINQQGYLTEADVKLMNRLGDQEIQRIKEQE